MASPITTAVSPTASSPTSGKERLVLWRLGHPQYLYWRGGGDGHPATHPMGVRPETSQALVGSLAVNVTLFVSAHIADTGLLGPSVTR
jgi:hypothetical protein